MYASESNLFPSTLYFICARLVANFPLDGCALRSNIAASL